MMLFLGLNLQPQLFNSNDSYYIKDSDSILSNINKIINFINKHEDICIANTLKKIDKKNTLINEALTHYKKVFIPNKNNKIDLTSEPTTQYIFEYIGIEFFKDKEATKNLIEFININKIKSIVIYGLPFNENTVDTIDTLINMKLKVFVINDAIKYNFMYDNKEIKDTAKIFLEDCGCKFLTTSIVTSI